MGAAWSEWNHSIAGAACAVFHRKMGCQKRREGGVSGNEENGENEMKKLYEKNELTFAIVWIVIYCVLQSFANPLNETIGIDYSASAGFCILQTGVLLTFIRKNNLQKKYGLCKSPVPARRFLYYVPLVLLASGNLGTVRRSIIHRRKRPAALCVCFASDFWRKRFSEVCCLKPLQRIM